MLNVAMFGASGRMGRTIVPLVVASTDLRLSGALAAAEDAHLGHDAGAVAGTTPVAVSITSDPDRALEGADVAIDFTLPAASLAHARACLARKVPLVIGTTGHDDRARAEIAKIAESIAVVMAPNMSLGVNVVLKLLDVAARALAEGYDIEIVEAHHRHKVDAPSGTALAMGEVLARASGRQLDECAVWGRHGVTGERNPSSIGFSVIRGGDIVGDHTVLFAGTGERIEISHRSASRATYAQGSLRAARFLAGRAPGLYGMNDVLGL